MRALIVVLVAAVLLPTSVARAETTPPGPGAPTDQPALALKTETLELHFPEANLNGSVISDGSVITLEADVFFAYNRATLNARAGAALDRAAAHLRRLGAARVQVAGHTDNKGTAAYNLALSRRRAAAVRAGLADRLAGVDVTIKAYGERRPVATNETSAGRALNRRVVLTMTG